MEREVTRRRFLRTGGAASALALAGCLGGSNPISGGGGGGPSGWPRPQRDAAFTGHTEASGPTGSVETEWSHDLGDEHLGQAPAVVGGTVYVADPDGVSALDAESGSEQWREEFDGSIGQLTVLDGTVYFESAGVRALDAADGSTEWTYDDVAERGKVTVADGTAYLAEWTGGLVALDAGSGEEQWTGSTDEGVPHQPAVADGTAYFVTRGGEETPSYLVAVDTESGEETARIEREAAIDQRPTVVDGTVYQQNGWAVGPTTVPGGEQAWGYDERVPRGAPSVAVDGSTVYFANRRPGTTHYQIVALDRSSGEPVWRRTLDGGVVAAPIVADGTVYLGTTEGTVYGLDAESGETAWQHALEGRVDASLAVANGRLYVAASEGGVYALAEA
ncbi:PQQ-binding-like beta-propeller repeat protein [Halosimplex pelagicum]|uniref:PQQ-binding-like beta-propeller repeat protein n=1 Tax=Halosimplex pelagicum TaxID=869886 RepID=A0A7D5TSB9_9EURY|nr:PQQ-binding-like beta-propeller repeat protein [Halosimplex pelagicum]QLH81892.1 PQQ-binding-like beta-propeller repeat protein [Halosimplex pelagicum]